MAHRCVCHRLDSCYQDEGRESCIDNIDLISMVVKITLNQNVRVSFSLLNVLKSSNPWDLFGKDAMKLGFDTVSIDCGRHEFPSGHFDRARQYFGQGVPRHMHQFFRVPVDDRRDQRLFTREVLVNGPNADASGSRYLVGARSIIAFFQQNVSGRFQDRIDRKARSFLRG